MKRYEKLGFNSYADYLKSDSWKEIKDKVFLYHGRKCFFCGWDGMLVVHHIRYTRKAFSGFVRDLIPLCHPCHEKINALQDSIGYEKATRVIAKEFNKSLPTRKQAKAFESSIIRLRFAFFE